MNCTPKFSANHKLFHMHANATPHRLLFIDDDEDDFLILNEALKDIQSDAELTYIQSCKHLDQLNGLSFDLIFLDINMPRMNGIECLKHLKSSTLSNIPVVMYSTTKNPQSIQEAYQSGANLFFRKPISFQALTAALKTLLSLNWKKPQLITNKYTEGVYKVFEVAGSVI